jgi:hypothetical protein
VGCDPLGILGVADSEYDYLTDVILDALIRGDDDDAVAAAAWD